MITIIQGVMEVIDVDLQRLFLLSENPSFIYAKPPRIAVYELTGVF